MNITYIVFIGLLLFKMVPSIYCQEINQKIVMWKIIDSISNLKSFRADVEEEDNNYLNKNKSTVIQKGYSDGSICTRINILEKFSNNSPADNSSKAKNNYIIKNNNGLFGIDDTSVVNLNTGNNIDNFKSYFISDWKMDSIINSTYNIEVSNGLLRDKKYWIVTKKIPSDIYNAQITSLKNINKMDSSKTDPTNIATSKIVFYFDEETYIPKRKEAYNNKGNLLYAKEIINLSKNPEISESYFEIPKNLKVEELEENVKKISKTINQ